MRFHLRAGEMVDIMTPAEHEAQIDRVVSMLARSQRPPNSIDRASEKATDSSGNMAMHNLFRVPVGMVAVMHRINVEAGSFTRAAPSTKGYLNFTLDTADSGHTFVGLPASGTTVAPASIVDSISAAKIAKGGQTFQVYGASLEVSTQYLFNCQILLWETEG